MAQNSPVLKKENLAIFPHSASPFYEAWYVKLNRRADRSALWLRFSLLRTLTDRQGFIHAVHFPGSEEKKIVAVRASYDLQRKESCFVVNQFPAIVRLGESVLEHGCSRGQVTGQDIIRWDLVFKSGNDFSFSYAPSFLKAVLSSRAGSPHVNIGVSGTFRVNEEEFSCETEPASQGHYSGKKYAHRWAWAHCNFFGEDGQDVAFEIIDVKISPYLPGFKSAFVRFRGQNYVMNNLSNLLFAKSRYKKDEWHFKCHSQNLTFEIDIKADQRRTADLEYEDVDHLRLVCHNTKLACSTLVVREKGRVKDSFTSSRTTAFEVVQRT